MHLQPIVFRLFSSAYQRIQYSSIISQHLCIEGQFPGACSTPCPSFCSDDPEGTWARKRLGRDRTSTHQLPRERDAFLQFYRSLQTHRTRADGIRERVGSSVITANDWARAHTLSLGINEGTAASRAVLPPPPPRAAQSRPGAVGVWMGRHSPLWVDTQRVTRSPDTILHSSSLHSPQIFILIQMGFARRHLKRR